MCSSDVELEQAFAALGGKQPTDELKKKVQDFQESAQKLQQDFFEYEKQQRVAAEELAKKEAELIKPIRDTIIQKVEAVAKDQNFAIVLNKEATVYATAAVDITAEVIKRCDAP